MKRPSVVGMVMALALLIVVGLAGSALAVPAKDGGGKIKDPDRPNPLAQALLQENEKSGNPQFLHGQMRPNNQRYDNVLTILVEFSYTESDPESIYDPVLDSTRPAWGPLHNEIPPPGSYDNTTLWVTDFSPAHYTQMLFDKSTGAKSMYNYYLEQSGGAYAVDGRVYGWVKVQHSEAYYGVNDTAGEDRDPAQLIVDAVAELGDSIPWAQFDKEDPYDLDGDGITSEPDGYVDHVQLVHAGEDESAGGGAQGTDAIWAHSWWVPYNWEASPYNLGGAPTSNPNVWVGAYTINPENGGTGVFCHEFGHDLGLPDVYDTIYSGEASTGFWTLMASGSWLGLPGQPLETSPSSMSVWDKWVLGWLKPQEVNMGEKVNNSVLKAATSKGPSGKAIKINLPSYEIDDVVNEPHSGDYEWWSGKGDNLNNALTQEFMLPAGAQLSFWTWYEIEKDWDYGYVQISTDGGATWTNLEDLDTLTTNDDPYGANRGNGITGTSGGWTEASFDLSAFEGQTVLLRFQYVTDGYVSYNGWAIDDITIDGFYDDVESGNLDWTANGWTIFEGLAERTIVHYYMLEWREPTGFDASMLNWYSWGYIYGDNWADFFRADPGLLIWYRNTTFTENWVGIHPWQGRLLLVDSEYEAIPVDETGYPVRTRLNLADAAFGVGTHFGDTIDYWGFEDAVQLPVGDQVSVFDDSKLWVDRTYESYIAGEYNPFDQAINSVLTPSYGLRVIVNSRMANNRGGKVTVDFSEPLETPDLPWPHK